MDGVEPLLTVAQVAAILNLSRRSTYRLIEQGRLRPVHPTPRTVRVTCDEVRMFLGALTGKRYRPR